MASQIEDNLKPMFDNIVSKRSNSSIVWRYFGFYKDNDKIQLDKTICKLCRAEKPYKGGNTSTMISHLTSHHSEVMQPTETKMKQPTMMDFSQKPLPKDGKLHQEITSKLGEWVISSLCPLSVVENDQFKSFVSSLNARYAVPCRQTLG